MPTENKLPTPGSEAFEKYGTPQPSKFDGDRPRRRGCHPLMVANSLIIGGALLAVLAIVYGTALPKVITNKIEDGVAICKAADYEEEKYRDAYGDCKDCTPYYYSLSMFNVTNAMEYLESNAKLQVTEVGPYTYRRRQIKVDIKLSDDATQVSYKQYTYHTFEPSLSCATCKDTDQVVSWDVSYLNVISQAGGELGFLRRLIAGTLWGKALTADAREEIIQANKKQLMKWTNGLNSNQPEAWKVLGSTITGVLAAGVSGIANLTLEGFAYNGLFAKRPISDWALGYPSLLAGLGLGTNYKNVCVGTKLNDKCAACVGQSTAECLSIWAACKSCATGAKVVSLNPITCGKIVAKYAAVYGAAEAQTAVNNTACALCDSFGVCAAPMPGAAEGSGLDWSKKAPNSSALNTYIQHTGCDDHSKIWEFVQYDGFTTQPYWVKLDSRRNPTLAEINAHAVYGNCAAKTANMTCSNVLGNDGTSTPPGGASITGFPSKVSLQTNNMYLNNAKQNITLTNTNEVVEYNGAKLTRFSPPNDLLSIDDVKALKGTGYPVNGVQPLAFNVGFLAYLSYPVFMYGDKSLLEGVEITMFDGKIASEATLYESDGKTLKSDYYNRYQTTVDVEAGTGKAMRARKRLQASYALAKSTYTADAPMSDVLWPKLKAEVISPAYIGEESATITDSRLSTYKGIKGILSSLLPSLITGIVVGVALVAFGFLKRRNALSARNEASFATV